ncbi:MAG: hypothetical protein ACRD21_27440 [Vicinamibacteria bacterium]
MLATVGILFLGVSAARFFWTLRRGVYRRYPYEQFALVGTAAVLGLLAVLERPGIVSGALFLLELGALVIVIRYFGFGVRFPRGEIGVNVGDRFPDFTLPDSDGHTFDSRSLLGSSTALYLFFRGHF